MAFVYILFGFLIMVAIVSVPIIIYYGSKKKKVIDSYNKQLMQLKSQGFLPEKWYSRYITVASASDVVYNYLMFDFTHNLCAYEFQVFSMADITEVHLINDATVVKSATSNMGGGALLGVVVPGVAGFGGHSEMNDKEHTAVVAVRILLNNPRNPSFMIPFLFNVVPKASKDYQDAVTCAYEAYGIFEMALRTNNETAAASGKKQKINFESAAKCPLCGSLLMKDAKFCSSCGKQIPLISEKTAEQINKLQQLRDDGILTEQEFESKKNILLNQQL